MTKLEMKQQTSKPEPVLTEKRRKTMKRIPHILQTARFICTFCMCRIQWSCEGLTSVHNKYTGYILKHLLLRHMCNLSLPMLVHSFVFQILGKSRSNTHVDFCFICVEWPNCHNLAMGVERVLCPQLLAGQLTGTSSYSLVQKWHVHNG